MRVSLYKHELEIVAELTVNLTRMCRDENYELKPALAGPQIFRELLDALYSRGNYQHTVWTPVELNTAEVDLP